ncbi:hypothetical protein TNCV_4871151 [Trichonephila clavipes]|nr:hypothetical protein TNCV_4871151 [Trichonephila clavipes]
MSLSPVPLKIHREEEKVNVKSVDVQTSSRKCGTVTAIDSYYQWVLNVVGSFSVDVLSSLLSRGWISFLVRLAARRLHESNLLESSSNAFKVTGSIAFHHLSCYFATLNLNTLSNLNIPYLFLELIGNKREFIFPRKTPKKISGKVPYRFVTTLA